jgi:two-component system, NtrC family, sensor kinase
MRLTAKFLLAITLVVAITLGISAWLTIERESALFDHDLHHDASAIGWLLARSYARAAELDGLAAAESVLRDPLLTHSTMRARWVPIDEVPDAIRASVASGLLRSVRRAPTPGGDRDGSLDTYVPLPLRGRGPGALELTASLRQEHRYLRATIWRWTATSLALLASAALAVLALGIALIARPTRALVDKARRVGAGDLGGPVVLRQRDELGLLARELNAMTEQLAVARDRVAGETSARLSAVEQLRHADRLTTVGKMASGIAHELGTPLNVIEGRARMIQTGEAEGEEVGDSARIIVEQSRRVTAIVRQLLDFARRGRAERSAADLRPIAGSTRNLMLAAARRADVELEIEPDDDQDAAACTAEIDDGQLVQVLTNLVSNAIAATPRGGRITLAVAPRTATPPRGAKDLPAGPIPVVALTVRDTGGGIDPALRERIFEPFFTTKDVGQGTGLGLAVVHGIVADHGGWIDVESEPGRGSAFTVYLPRIA